MTAFRQELFGPVASIITARDAAHALALANDSEFGLTATVFSRDLERPGNWRTSWRPVACSSTATAPPTPA